MQRFLYSTYRAEWLRSSALMFGIATIANLATLKGAYAQGTPPPTPPTAASEKGNGGQATPTLLPDILGGLGYQYGLLYNFTASTVDGASSDAFQNTQFNSLFGFSVDNRSQFQSTIVFNVTDRAVLDTGDGFGRKYLLPTQTGFVMDGGLRWYVDRVNPLFYDALDGSPTRRGFYFKGGFSPAEYRFADNSKTSGTIGFASAGAEMRFPHFKVDDGAIGLTLRVGVTARTLIHGFNDDRFWSDIGRDGSRRRTDLGLEGQLQFSIGSFRPTVMVTHFNPKGNIKEFSGTTVSFLFDVGSIVPLNRRKEARAKLAVDYLQRYIQKIKDKGTRLSQRELDALTELCNRLDKQLDKRDRDALIAFFKKAQELTWEQRATYDADKKVNGTAANTIFLTGEKLNNMINLMKKNGIDDTLSPAPTPAPK